ncbi:MAG: hypothetical protein ABUT20_21155 [Bacteroidota bacterium]
MKVKFLYHISVVVFLASCHTPRYVYAPSPPDIPYFKEKNDSKISGYYSIGNDQGNGEKNNGYDIQGAYAITDHWAMTFDQYYRKERDIYNFSEYSLFDTSTVNYSRNITSFGSGYFRKMNRKGTVSFNIYGGVGFGKLTINENGIDDTLAVYSRIYKSNLTKWYLQPGFNFMPRKAFWCSVTTRFVFIKYSKITTSYTLEELNYFRLQSLNGRTLSFFEPSYNMQVDVPHCPWLKINGGVTFSLNVTPNWNENNGTYHDSRGVTASVGLTFDPSKIKTK